MNWRTWLYENVTGNAPLLTLLPQPNPEASIHGAGSLQAPPVNRPFLVIKMEPTVPGPFPGAYRGRVAFWAHDEPGDYLRLDSLLSAVRQGLGCAGGVVGQVVQVGAVGVRWQGDSADLSDPDFGTILRTSTYDLLGKE